MIEAKPRLKEIKFRNGILTYCVSCKYFNLTGKRDCAYWNDDITNPDKTCCQAWRYDGETR